MVNRIACSLLALTLVCFVSAQSTDNNPKQPYSEFNDIFETSGTHLIRPYKMTAIKSVVIHENAAWDPGRSTSDEPAEACRTFVLTEAEVKDFFRCAERINGMTYVGGLSISRCYATGEISFANGDHGAWVIDAERRGEIKFSDGRNIYFFGKNARAKALHKYGPENSNEGYVEPPKVRIGPIKSITLRPDRPQWGLSNDQKAGICHFDLSESDVRDYFLHAKIVDLPTYMSSNLPHSTCRVEGEIVFASGLHGVWVIESGRRGVLELNNGSSAYLFSKDARAKAFDKP